jgi:hypothetical protein
MLAPVALLRRTAAPVAGEDPATAVPAEDPQVTPGKGRPTPKRSEARKSRRQPVPKTRKEAEKLRRERNREQRQLSRRALLTGDERNLPARDRGPARRMARDAVDSRFMLGQFALVMILVLFLLSLTSNIVIRVIVQLALLVMTAAVIGQAFVVARETQRRIIEVHGADDARGVRSYTFWRALSARRLRRPPPRVKRGGHPV